MQQFIQIIRRLLLAVNWLIMSIISLGLFLGAIFGDLGFWGFIGAIIFVALAVGIQKLINWVLLGSAFQNSLQSKGFSKDNLSKLSEYGLGTPSSGKDVQLFTLPDGEQFTISSPGWLLANASNSYNQNLILETRLKDHIDMAASNPNYNYLYHPKSLPDSNIDFIQIMVSVADGEPTTEKNLSDAYDITLAAFKRMHPKVLDFTLDLIERPKIEGLPKSLLATLKLPMHTDDMVSIQTKNKNYVVMCSATDANREFYKRTVFEIVDSLKWANG